MTSWPELSAALARHTARQVAGAATRAAVALILRDGPETAGLEQLFIRRAEHEKDPWSGHIGFPGGRAESGDATAEATAVRETREETGIDLARDGERIGELDDVQALARGPQGIDPGHLVREELRNCADSRGAQHVRVGEDGKGGEPRRQVEQPVPAAQP